MESKGNHGNTYRNKWGLKDNVHDDDSFKFIYTSDRQFEEDKVDMITER